MEIGSLQMNQPVVAGVQPITPEMRAENRELIEAVKALNATEMFGQDNELEFLIDRETHRPLIRVVNRETKEVIRQIPPEYMLRIAEDLKL